LSYVIRKDLANGTDWNELDYRTQQIHTAALEDFIFTIDSKHVLTLLKELCLDTEAESWFKNAKCGRESMTALQLHYDGPDENKRRKEEARSQLKTLFYKHEASFPFEKFITALNDAFQVLDKYGEPLYETEKLRLLITKCQNAHQEFKQEVLTCRSRCGTFIEAVTYLKTVIARLFPELTRGRSRRNISSSKTSKETVNGVDVSDLTRWFETSEIKKLNQSNFGKRILKKIMSNKDHYNRHKGKIRQNSIRQEKEDQFS